MGLSRRRKRREKSKSVSFLDVSEHRQSRSRKNIPVIIQTGDGKYYVAETTTGERKKDGKTYVAVSQSLVLQKQYKEILEKGEQYSSLEAAYDAYLKALGDSKYDSVRQP